MRKLLLRSFYRIYQSVFKMAMPFLPWRRPVLLEGAGSIKKLPGLLEELKIKNVLIVTDSTLMKLGLLDNLIKELGINGCKLVLMLVFSTSLHILFILCFTYFQPILKHKNKIPI